MNFQPLKFSKFSFDFHTHKHRILLVNPWIYDFAAYDFWIKPLGLLYLASLLRQYGFEVILLDCLDRFDPEYLAFVGPRYQKQKRFHTGKFYREVIPKPFPLRHIPRQYGRYGWPVELVQRKLRQMPQPDAILVTSVMTYWYPAARDMVQLLRSIFPGVPIILGGIYATLCPEHAEQVVQPDVVVSGEGEVSIFQVLRQFIPDVPLPKIADGLDARPNAAYDLYPQLVTMPILTSRGCPYRCSFCASFLVAKGYRRRSPEKVVDEIEYYYRHHGVRNFAFYDDALLLRKHKHIIPILEGIISRKIRANFHTPNGLHAREIDVELADKMFRAGVKTIHLSFETANPQRLQDMNSKVTLDDLRMATENLEQVGFQRKRIEAYVLVGLPGQLLEEMVESMLAMHRLGIKIRLSEFSPIPGTREWERALQLEEMPEDADLLLTNNSVYPINQGTEKFRLIEQLRFLSRILNQAVDLGINLANDSALAQSINRGINQLLKLK